MQLLLLGTNHRTATVDQRGRLAASINGAGEALLEKSTGSGIAELMVLGTCHRVEFYVVARDLDAAETWVRAYVARVASEDLLAPGEARYRLTGEAAVAHLCRVASGLDSMIVGESEIAGQLRRAMGDAIAVGAAGVLLERTVAGALRASGRARSETRIAAGAMSAATAAVTIVEQMLDALGSTRVLVIGAGQAGRQALARLAKRGAGQLTIASRSERHARAAADATGALAIGLEHLPSALVCVDAVIAATVSPTLLITPDTLVAATPRPRLFVDLSMPRVIDPAIAAIDGVTLRTVDDLGDIVRASTAKRASEIPRVEAIVRDEARRAHVQFQRRVERMRMAGQRQ